MKDRRLDLRFHEVEASHTRWSGGRSCLEFITADKARGLRFLSILKGESRVVFIITDKARVGKKCHAKYFFFPILFLSYQATPLPCEQVEANQVLPPIALVLALEQQHRPGLQAVQLLAQKIQKEMYDRNDNAMGEKANKGVGEKRAADSSLTGYFSYYYRLSLYSSIF